MPAAATPSSNTIRNLEAVEKALTEFFGADTQLRNISVGGADSWRLAMISKGWGDNTLRRRCGFARQFFNVAIRQRLIDENPFKDMKTTVRARQDRFFYVTRDMAAKVLDACPNTQWKAIFALCRFGGLRCPSELLKLTWADVDWANARIRVRSPKTEHHDGGESRIIPLFPELRPILQQAFDEAEPGTLYVISQYRVTNSNLRTTMEKIIWRAGLKPWQKLFNNLRSTRETELAEVYPMHVVCRWIGNSKPVAAENYLQLTEDHFRKASGGDIAKTSHSADETSQKASQPIAESNGKSKNQSKAEENENAELVGACSDPQNDSQTCNTPPHARDRNRTCTPFGTGT